MKKAFTQIGIVLFSILTAAVFLFSVGTVLPRLPVIGSVANIVTVGYLHLWLPLCLLLVLVSLLLLLARRKEKKWLFMLACSLISLLCTVVFTCANAAAVKEYGVKPHVFLSKEDVSSVTVETFPVMESEYSELALNVYYAEDGETDKPVMIYIHGGGWIQGTKEAHEYYSKAFVKHGYVVFSVDYDLSTADRHLAEITELQVAEAFAWVKIHAAEFGADPSRLYVTGGSAGGNLALELAYKINSGVCRTSADGTELPKVKAVSVTFPVASVETFYNNSDPVLGGLAYKMASYYTGCSPEEDPDLYARLAPGNFITSDAAPTCIVVGAGDSLVPPDATYALSEALQAAGIPQQTVVVPYGNHMFDMVDGNMLNCAYLELSLRWFEQFP